MIRLEVVRDEYSVRTTLGILFVEGKFFSYTLEDTVRPIGIKVKGETAIPEGTYKISLNMSPKFKRYLPFVHNVPQFVGIRFHRLNSIRGTAGCIGVGYGRSLRTHRISKSTQAEKDLIEAIKNAGGEAILTVRNCFREDR